MRPDSHGGDRSWPARVLVAVLRFYRTGISPLRPAACRFVPSCSAYAVEAIESHGAWRGCWLAARRVLRCHPFHRGGHDPVPSRVASAVSPERSQTRVVADPTAPVSTRAA